MDQSMLSLEGVVAGYGPVTALHGVSLHVNRGEIVTLIGANGAGKSTLLMSIFGNPRVQQGVILFDGEEITQQKTHHIAKMGIAQVPEGRRIFAEMTVMENLAMGVTPLAERDEKLEAESLERVLILFPRLKERAKQRAGTLSGGEQQMLAIGRALMSRPRLLLLDEPSLGLAPLVIKQIFANLRQIADEGTTIFLVEQNANQALKLADRGYVLVNGRITLSGSGESLLSDPEVRNAYLGGH
uniref:High-affinity branched-chain amino acid ABC transporter (ATP-binding protein) n=1 Tax=Magnetococcus massalia (strain MO-1) TaxID=451514 RepID=A0A1S7LLY1_MAGMO|nr:High-affinity branched-chain amino acid ABC transporter (ATP-binding protein) [Candidatus Magnetococcus massalia]